jgi:hypothetical protein
LLTWEPKEYGGITILRLLIDQIWNPDLFLYNAAEKDSWNQWYLKEFFYSFQFESLVSIYIFQFTFNTMMRDTRKKLTN